MRRNWGIPEYRPDAGAADLGALLCGKLRNGAAGLYHCGGYHAGTADVKA